MERAAQVGQEWQAEGFPAESRTWLGTGEAVVTVLGESGAPTPVAATRLRAPRSLMGPVGDAALDAALDAAVGPRCCTRAVHGLWTGSRRTSG